MNELFIENNQLISFEQWKQKIKKIKERIEKNSSKKKSSMIDVQEALRSAIIKRIPQQGCSVFFSGGIDSTLIAYYSSKHHNNITCVSVGFQDGHMDIPQDIVISKQAAEAFSLHHTYKVFNDKEAKNILKEVLHVLDLQEPLTSQDIVNIGVAMVIYAVKMFSDDTVYLAGLGSEELFAGYERHAKADDVQEECWAGLINMWNKDLVRDCALTKAMDIDVLTPFLDEHLISVAMKLPAKEKIADEYKKVVLRKIADSLQYPKKIAWRKKKAAQYGSGAHKMLQRLGRQAGFGKVKDYIVSLIKQK